MMVVRIWSWVMLVIAAIALATAVRADTQQQTVLGCFEGMGASTEWNQCLNLMFAPCADEDVGSEAHIGCLGQEREGWRQAKLSVEADILARLTDSGMETLSGLMLAWPQFVEDKCKAVAESRAAISYDAAALGCQISELALLTNEMTACLDGRSTEEYCQLRTK